jgi:hypothetical protein
LLENGITGLTVSPNPASDEVLFDLSGQSGRLSIFDFYEKVIFDKPFENHLYWHSQNAPVGIYGYTLRLGNGSLVSGKIMVAH